MTSVSSIGTTVGRSLATLATTGALVLGAGLSPAVAAPAPASTPTATSTSTSTSTSESAATAATTGTEAEFGMMPAGEFSTLGSTYVGGGYFEWGVTSSTVYAKYQHYSRTHRATACANGQTQCLRSGNAAPSYLASAVRAKSKSNNTAWWAVL